MSNRRPLNWGAVLRDFRSDRIIRPEIREERLRSDISAWRGKTGCRSVFTVERLEGLDAGEAIGALALFIRRNTSGIGSIAFAVSDPDRIEVGAALRAARERGCIEVHLHRLSDADAYPAIIDDLNAPVLEAA